MKDTKTKILDAAEKLIMELGEEKATLRKITAEAGVNIAAINYHFGCRENLVTAIMARFLDPLDDEMGRRLEDAVAAAGEGGPGVEEIIRCYLVPLLEFSEKYPNHVNLFIWFFNSYGDENLFRQNIEKSIEKTVWDYCRALVRALPGVPEETVLLRFAFLRNTSMGIMKGDCIMVESLSILGLHVGRNQMIEQMTTYIAAGFRA